MKAVVVERHTTPDTLELREVATSTPKAHEVFIRVEAASINDWDWALLQNGRLFERLFNRLTARGMRILGCDVAGRVEAVGADVKAFRPGDEVYGDLSASGFGAFAEYACASETALTRKPPGMTFEQAAAIPQAAMLAVQGLIDVGRIRDGQQVLLNGAGGGVGTFALQLARLHDGVEVTVVDKAGKLDMLRAMGASHVIDFATQDFTRQGRSYDLILDVKTNRWPLDYARALKPGGVYATVGGQLSKLPPALLLGLFLSRWSGKHLRVVALKPNKDLAYVNELFEAGKLVPVIDGTYPFAQVRAAFQRFGTGDHRGKVILRMR